MDLQAMQCNDGLDCCFLVLAVVLSEFSQTLHRP